MRNVGRYSFRVGEFTVTTLNDGRLQGGLDLVVGISPRGAEDEETANCRALPPLITVNGFLVQSKRSTWLVDAGCGASYGPNLGNIGREFLTLGLTPDDIDAVLMTHLHPDHANGLLDASGQRLFPRADLILHEAEAPFWLDDAQVQSAPLRSRGGVAGARDVLGAYRSQLHSVAGGHVLHGLSAVPEPGHTPGHTGWLLDSCGEQLLIWGDIVHLPGIQFGRPEAGMAFDVDVNAARETRLLTLSRVVENRLRVAGMHLDFPAVGHVTRADRGYRFVPDVWNLEIP